MPAMVRKRSLRRNREPGAIPAIQSGFLRPASYEVRRTNRTIHTSTAVIARLDRAT
jgi:hypothetical protein